MDLLNILGTAAIVPVLISAPAYRLSGWLDGTSALQVVPTGVQQETRDERTGKRLNGELQRVTAPRSVLTRKKGLVVEVGCSGEGADR